MSVSEAEVPAQPSLAVLVVRALGVAALVVGVSAALFWTIGRGGDDGLVVADGPDDEVSAEDDTTEEEPSGEEAAPEPDPPAEPDPEPEPEPDGAEDPDEGSEEPDPDPEEPAEPEDPDEPEEPSADRIDPSTVSVQVLDGYQADGGAAAAAVADELTAAGYRIIARNPAIAYDVTTVLWTAGSQAAAEQVARDIGAAEVRQQPGNLAESVMVHVVIGADRG
ncbi:MAG: LytR C-terminal domain-containing protein [Nitriliruptoraceae bacterium]